MPRSDPSRQIWNKTETKEFRLAVWRGIVEESSCRERAFPLQKVKEDGSYAPPLPGSHLPDYLDQRRRCDVCKSDKKTYTGCSASGCIWRGFCLTQKRNCFYDHHQLGWLDYYWLDLYWIWVIYTWNKDWNLSFWIRSMIFSYTTHWVIYDPNLVKIPIITNWNG